MKYTEQAVETLDDAGSVIANKNIEIEQLRQRVQELEKERDHWKNNHETEVRRARILKERTDMPIERVQAYEKWGKDIAERDELLAAAEAIEINAEECLDFDECTAMLVQIDDYHKLMEAIASVKEK